MSALSPAGEREGGSCDAEISAVLYRGLNKLTQPKDGIINPPSMLTFSDHEPHMVAASFKRALPSAHLERLFGVRELQ